MKVASSSRDLVQDECLLFIKNVNMFIVESFRHREKQSEEEYFLLKFPH